MSTLTVAQATTYARNAGFSGSALTTIVAIAIAESGLQTDIRGHTDSRDRGIVQINSFWHPEVSDACAFDPQCAFQQAYRISQAGTNFNQWNTFTGGAYKQYLAQAGGGSVTTKATGGGCPWYCNIPTGIVGLTVSVPGADCSGCNNTTDVAPINKVIQAVQDPTSVISASIAGTLAYASHAGLVVGVFVVALVLMIAGLWVISS